MLGRETIVRDKDRQPGGAGKACGDGPIHCRRSDAIAAAMQIENRRALSGIRRAGRMHPFAFHAGENVILNIHPTPRPDIVLAYSLHQIR